jgi:hypothetical protein
MLTELEHRGVRSRRFELLETIEERGKVMLTLGEEGGLFMPRSPNLTVMCMNSWSGSSGDRNIQAKILALRSCGAFHRVVPVWPWSKVSHQLVMMGQNSRTPRKSMQRCGEFLSVAPLWTLSTMPQRKHASITVAETSRAWLWNILAWNSSTLQVQHYSDSFDHGKAWWTMVHILWVCVLWFDPIITWEAHLPLKYYYSSNSSIKSLGCYFFLFWPWGVSNPLSSFPVCLHIDINLKHMVSPLIMLSFHMPKFYFMFIAFSKSCSMISTCIIYLIPGAIINLILWI